MARFILPGVALHIVQRGNNRADCFRRDADYMLYLLHLRELAEEFDCPVHAYCLMTNHVHLLITPSSADACSALMRNLGQRYVQHFNKAHERTGTLWEGRYRSCVVESARYVLACYRYIELNPVRARMTAEAGEYPWSSHRANAGKAVDPLVTSHIEYLALGAGEESRRRAYLELFQQDIDAPVLEGIRGATNGGYPLGSEAFRSHILDAHGRRIERGRPGRPMKKRVDADLKSMDIGL